MPSDENPALFEARLARRGQETTDWLVVEEPLEMRIDGRSVAVVLRTPGQSVEEDLDLVAGFLLTEGVIEDIDDLSALAHCTDPARENRGNVVIGTLATGMGESRRRLDSAQREMYVGSSCGLCGKATIDRVFQSVPPLEQRLTLKPEVVAKLPELLRRSQPRFDRTGGLHGAVICTADGQLKVAAEDIGRHNAVDKVIGNRLRADEFPLDGHVLVVSSRAGFEIVQKAIMVRIGAVVAVGAASSLAHQLARRSGLNLYSFARGREYNHHPVAPEPASIG